MTKNRLLLSLALILFFHLSQAQLIMIDGETGEYKYEEVVSAEGISKQEIKDRADKWLNLNYKDSFLIINDSTSLRKKGHNKISWKFINKNIPIEIFFDIEIKAKENRYKYTFSNFKIGKEVYNGIDASSLKVYIERFPQKYQIYIEEPVDAEITKAISSLEYFILNNQLEKNADDW